MLDLFCNSGGFSLNALAADAARCVLYVLTSLCLSDPMNKCISLFR